MLLNQQNCCSTGASLKAAFDISKDHFIGSANASVEIVEYADFQCPYSGELYSVIKLLQQRMGNQIRLIFRHFPLPAFHSLALEAAVAAEAAALQGKFWPMHDAIFENQRFLVKSSFARFAEKINMDTTLFEDGREYKRILRKVLIDFESGLKSGVDGTPTLFINGGRYSGFLDAPTLYRTCQNIMSVHTTPV
jgi:protein-disulfide isomerase